MHNDSTVESITMCLKKGLVIFWIATSFSETFHKHTWTP